MGGLRIGEVARGAGVGVETIRYYERIGLLDRPPRAASGYRQYPASVVPMLRFISQAKTFGFTLREIRELINLRVEPGASACRVRDLAETKLQEVEARIGGLRRLRRALAGLVASCDGKGPVSECPIIDALAETEWHTRDASRPRGAGKKRRFEKEEK